MKNNFKLSIFYIFSIIFILFLIDNFLAFTVKKCDTGNLGKVNKIFNNTSKPQIAIFGPSVGLNGFNSLQLQNQTHKTVYNFCLEGTLFTQYEGLINELNERSKTTETLVLSEFIYTFEPRKEIVEVENYLPYLSNNNVYTSLYAVNPEVAFKCRYIPFYRLIASTYHYYNSSLKGTKNLISKPKKNTDTLMGFFPVDKKWNKNEDAFLATTTHLSIPIDSNIVKEYTKCVSALRQKGRKVIITITPIYIPKGQTAVDLAPLRNTFKEIAKKTNSTFWDFSEAMVDKKYFHSVNHLNAYGAAVFSSLFADSLNRMK